MQRVTCYLLTPKDFDFRRFFLHINGQSRQKIKASRVHDINVTRGKTLPDSVAFENGYWFKTIFSLIMLGMVTL